MMEWNFNLVKRVFRISFSLGIALVWGFALYGEVSSHANVVLIMTDDQGYGDVSIHGNPHMETPFMDRIAKEGARFDRFFVSPVCAPTRASLLTGRYNLRAGVFGVTGGAERMRPEEVTVAEVFKKAGYATGCFGKWHNGSQYPFHPNGQGFDEFIGFCAGHINNFFDTTIEHNGKPVKAEGYVTDFLTDRVLEFFQRNREKPFFCYVPYNPPHTPWQVSDDYFNKYTNLSVDEQARCAYAMVKNLDDNIGRILGKLDELEIARNTIVLFLTDNGPNSKRYNDGMRGRKGSVHEGGVRVPLFIRWPEGITPGLVIEPISAHIDILPTLVELCQIEMPDSLKLDGRSLAPLLRGTPKAGWPDRMIFTTRKNGVRGSVRTQQFRAVGKELYDMQLDPGQKVNVAKKYPETHKKLSKAYKDFINSINIPVEALPCPVGYDNRLTVLPGNEARIKPTGTTGLSYFDSHGWAHDWLANWKDSDAYACWDIDVVEAGSFAVYLEYQCRPENVGGVLRFELDGTERVLELTIDEAFVGEQIPSPDRIKRKEVYEMTWKNIKAGSIELVKGRNLLNLCALDIRGGEAPSVKSVSLKRLK